MPVEFPCQTCGQRLRVPDGLTGKKTKCPKCESIMEIPAEGEVAFPLPPGSPPTPVSKETQVYVPGEANPFGEAADQSENAAETNFDNPYAAPTAPTAFSQQDVGPLAFADGRLDAANAVSIAWQMFQANLGMLVGVSLIFFAINFAFGMANESVRFAYFGLDQGQMQDNLPPAFVALNVVFSLASNIFQLWMDLGVINITLRIARGQEATTGMLFGGGKYLLRAIGGTIIFAVCVSIGLLLFIVPGIWLVCTWWPFLRFIIDRDCGVFESFRLSSEATKGNKGQALLLGLISFALLAIGTMLCFVGLLFTYPLVVLSVTISYLMISGNASGSSTPSERLASEMPGSGNPFA